MDSKLVSTVRDLENEAERIIQKAREQAAAIRHDNEGSNSRLIAEKKLAAAREAENLIKNSRTQTQKDLEQSRIREKAALTTLLQGAEARLEKAVKLIMDQLGKL